MTNILTLENVNKKYEKSIIPFYYPLISLVT